MTIPIIRKGDVIRAPYLNQMATAINGNASPPESAASQIPPDDGTFPAGTLPDDGETWLEASREETTVRVENPDDSAQYVNVDRMDSVSLTLPDGRRVRLQFDNS